MKLQFAGENIIEKKMTLAQIADARKPARKWRPGTWEELSQKNDN